MKAKIIATVLVIMAVAMYTTAVINFMAGQVLPGITDLLMACSVVIMAWALIQIAKGRKFLRLTAKTLAMLIEQLEKGVSATLTVKDGKGTVTLGHDDDPDPEEETAASAMQWFPISEKPSCSGTYMIWEVWPNGHPFCFAAHYDKEKDEWRPWEDIDVDGMPLDETQRETITHWMPVVEPESNGE